jgi:uncharacterized protein YodC (DUF2158 family)
MPDTDGKHAAVVKEFGLDGPIKEGDVVRLVSGGPSMTVEEVFEESARCQWFEKARLRTHKFKLSCLQKTTPEQLGVVYFEGLGSNSADSD